MYGEKDKQKMNEDESDGDGDGDGEAKESGIIRWDSQGINKIQRCLNDPPFLSQAERPPRRSISDGNRRGA
jgi:hypothetical protein